MIRGNVLSQFLVERIRWSLTTGSHEFVDFLESFEFVECAEAWSGMFVPSRQVQTAGTKLVIKTNKQVAVSGSACILGHATDNESPIRCRAPCSRLRTGDRPACTSRVPSRDQMHHKTTQCLSEVPIIHMLKMLIFRNENGVCCMTYPIHHQQDQGWVKFLKLFRQCAGNRAVSPSAGFVDYCIRWAMHRQTLRWRLNSSARPAIGRSCGDQVSMSKNAS